MKYYKVHRVMTGKAMGNKQDDYSRFDDQIETFPTLNEAKQFLKDTYRDCKRTKMYRDLTNGQSEHIGYVYHFKSGDISHYPVDKWYQQDWVTITKVNEEYIKE
jgi:hypothetical protein